MVNIHNVVSTVYESNVPYVRLRKNIQIVINFQIRLYHQPDKFRELNHKQLKEKVIQ